MPYLEGDGEMYADEDISAAESSRSGYGLIDNTQYLTRCQVDTPDNIVAIVWDVVHRYRKKIGCVLDAGAGDGRFAKKGEYREYYGYEIDSKRISVSDLPTNANLINRCAFSQADLRTYDLSIGNPPYVRHHDLSDDWRKNISAWIKSRTGHNPSGLSNAYLYFLWLSLIATNSNGLIALVIPFEWVDRPAAKGLRDYIASQGWALDVYKFAIDPFPRVLTTASITVIDKSQRRPAVKYYSVDFNGNISCVNSATKSDRPPLKYQAREGSAYAQRGFSPGGQEIFTITEKQRKEYDLIEGRDVVPCVTTMKHLDHAVRFLNRSVFDKKYIDQGKKCWLIFSRTPISPQLENYLSTVPEEIRDNYTCNKRAVWWQYSLPLIPAILYGSGFRGSAPKFLINEIAAVAVGAVCGIHSLDSESIERIAAALEVASIDSEVVPASRGFTKIEVNQMNSFIARAIQG